MSKSKVKFFASIKNRLMMSFAVIVMILVTVILFVVRANLKNGLTEYFESQLNTRKMQLNASIETKKTELRMQADYIASELSDDHWEIYSSGLASFDKILFNMKNTFFSDGYVIYDRDYAPIAENSSYKLVLSSVIQDAVNNGERYIDLLKFGSDIFIVCGSPIKDLDDNVTASVYAFNRLSSRGFVNEVGELAACDVTIFDGYKRYVTTIDKLQGTVLSIPTRSQIDTPVAEHLIVELYSK